MAHPLILSFKKQCPPSVSAKAASNLYIFHGLLGNANNWSTAAKQLVEHPSIADKVKAAYAFDARNHGDSPHNTVHTNAALASDIEGVVFRGQRELRQALDVPRDYNAILDGKAGHPRPARCVAIGHSMGGLALMGMLLRRYNEAALLPSYAGRPDADLTKMFCGWSLKDRAQCSAGMHGVNNDEGFAETQPLREMLFADPNTTPGSTGTDMGRVPQYGRIGAAVVVDMTPTIHLGEQKQPGADSVLETLRSMSHVDLNVMSSYSAAAQELQRVGIADKAMRDFVATNVVLGKEKGSPARWKCNLEVLLKQYGEFRPNIVGWYRAYDAETKSTAAVEASKKDSKCLEPKPCTLPTLFVFGEKSPYNEPTHRAEIARFFPNSKQVVVDGAGHFVHFEKTKAFVDVVAPFIAEHI